MSSAALQPTEQQQVQHVKCTASTSTTKVDSNRADTGLLVQVAWRVMQHTGAVVGFIAANAAQFFSAASDLPKLAHQE